MKKHYFTTGFVFVFLALLLAGCGPKTETGNVVKNYDMTMRNQGDGTQELTVVLEADTATETEGGDTSASQEISPRSAMGWNGSNAALNEAGEQVLEGLSAFWQVLEDRKKKNSDNTTTTTAPAPAPTPAPAPVVNDVIEVGDLTLQTRFHHTTTGSSDGGKSLVFCPGQVMDFEKCEADGVDIPRHRGDDAEATDRETYWQMKKEPQGNIVCTKDGLKYVYQADAVQVDGKCD